MLFRRLIFPLLGSMAVMLVNWSPMYGAMDGINPVALQAETLPASAAHDTTPALEQSAADQSPEAVRRRELTATHGSDVAEAILSGIVLKEMTMEQVLLARGDPVRKEMIPPDAELWYYPNGEVAFSGERVSYVSLEAKPEANRHRASGTHEKQGETQTADESDGTSIGMVSGIADASGERALELSPARRRQVQAWLGVLGFKPGPPDGAFGPGTRRSIEAWQAAAGLPSSGFLNAFQLKRLESEAESEEAETIYWEEIRATESIKVLENFIALYPNGIHAILAQNRIQLLRQASTRTPRSLKRVPKPSRRGGSAGGSKRYSPKEQRAIEKFNSL